MGVGDMKLRILLGSFLTLVAGCADAGEIRWDRYGIPHIYGATVEEAVYGYGYAQMENHAEQLLLNIAAARGRYAEYFGAGPKESHLQHDIYIHNVRIPERSQRWLETGGETQQRIVEAFAAGANAYGREHHDRIGPAMRKVLPVQPVDVIALTQWTMQYVFAANDAYWLAEAWKAGTVALKRRPIHGSNAWAVAPSRTVTGSAVLIGNPHLPFGASSPAFGAAHELPVPMEALMQFTQAHLIIGDPREPQVNLAGASFIGAPYIALGFTDALGWTHTVNDIRPSDLFELELKGDSYRFGDARRKLTTRIVGLKVCNRESVCETRKVRLEESIHGPILGRRGERAVAMRLADPEAPAVIDQYWQMAQARDFDEFKRAFSRLQIPYFNLIYADRAGRIAYVCAGRIPFRKSGTYADWAQLLPGDDPALLSGRILRWDELPKAIDPPGGFVQNSNDSPWTATFPQVLRAADYPPWIARNEMDLRPQQGALFLQSKPRFTVDELQAGIRVPRMMMAERVLSDLLRAADAADDPITRRAAQVLRNWDGMSTASSRGAALFEQWFEIHSATLTGGKPLYREPYDPSRPLTTPVGLADAPAALDSLTKAAQALESKHGRIDVAWGDTHRIRLATRDASYLNPRLIGDFPASGNDYRLSSLHMIGYLPPDERGIRIAQSGETHVQVVEFARDGAKARWVLTYGNSTRPGTPHLTDQIPAFLSGELIDVPRSRAQVEAATARVQPFKPALHGPRPTTQ
jgi:acyl-homoserine-lactone acylase